MYKGTRGAEPVAIKVVTGQNDRAVKDFRREVQTLMSLHCTYIVQFLGACITVRAPCCAGPGITLWHPFTHALMHKDNGKGLQVCSSASGLLAGRTHRQALHDSAAACFFPNALCIQVPVGWIRSVACAHG